MRGVSTAPFLIAKCGTFFDQGFKQLNRERRHKLGGSAALTQSRIKASERAFSAVADNGDTHRKEFGYGKRKRLKFRYDKFNHRAHDNSPIHIHRSVGLHDNGITFSRS